MSIRNAIGSSTREGGEKSIVVIAITICFALSIGLAGCDNNAFRSPLTVQRDGQTLLVAMCGQEVDVERIYASSQNRDDGVSWQRFWDANGNATLKTGDIVSFDGDERGLEIVVNDWPLLTSGTDLAITMVSVLSGASLSADFYVRDETLSETAWLHTDGSTSETPCGDLVNENG